MRALLIIRRLIHCLRSATSGLASGTAKVWKCPLGNFRLATASKTRKLTSAAALPLSTARSSLETSLSRFFSTAPTKHLLFRLTAFANSQRGSHECRSARRNADAARRAQANSAPALRSAVCFLPAATIGKLSAFWPPAHGILPACYPKAQSGLTDCRRGGNSWSWRVPPLAPCPLEISTVVTLACDCDHKNAYFQRRQDPSCLISCSHSRAVCRFRLRGTARWKPKCTTAPMRKVTRDVNRTDSHHLGSGLWVLLTDGHAQRAVDWVRPHQPSPERVRVKAPADLRNCTDKTQGHLFRVGETFSNAVGIARTWAPTFKIWALLARWCNGVGTEPLAQWPDGTRDLFALRFPRTSQPALPDMRAR